MASDLPIFRLRDRRQGGIELAQRLSAYRRAAGAMVLALPRGGVPVAYEVALALELPLDIFTVRKLGVPGHEELAMGAIASGGVYLLNDDVIDSLRIPRSVVLAAIGRETHELDRRERLYRAGLPERDLHGKTVILVDDGVATGASIAVAIAAVRRSEPARVVAAVPVGSAPICRKLREQADEVICAHVPEPLYSVGTWYEDFDQTTDDDVRALLKAAAARTLPEPG